MASIGQIIFGSMIFLIILISGLIILILAIAFSVSQGTVETSTPSTVGNLEQDVVLDCKFLMSGSRKFDDVSITWLKDGLSGVVYDYKNKAPQLQGQNAQFNNRALLFQNEISTGNASLVLRNVKLGDEGVYRCRVNAAKISGTVSVNLRVAAFSAPTFTIQTNGSLTADAQRWFPLPEVTWSSQSGQLLNSSSRYSNNSVGITRVVSLLKAPVKADDTYTCVIQNNVVKAVAEATVTDNKVTGRTYFIFSGASTKALSLHILLAVVFLYFVLDCSDWLMVKSTSSL
ncbi:V-set domain-containing T-cell activation inhibitor 1 isoform X2 [Triplophysa dalaica]|uniref:V-set domain-containing T-cell activation inhibitor 1 isoform X2 n=1 Tax=Triplophysa dalaica TaxID=1582913 RepID=UPI0024DFDB33|nr:V-set domain-containing T-cell activation inhibitor 1 isoform X2 [Triplophysa dalaica]